MVRLIDADALIKRIPTVMDMQDVYLPIHFKELLIDEAPIIDAVPVRHGIWMPREEGKVYPFWERYTCSVCGEHADNTKYCPNCGADMRGDAIWLSTSWLKAEWKEE